MSKQLCFKTRNAVFAAMVASATLAVAPGVHAQVVGFSGFSTNGVASVGGGGTTLTLTTGSTDQRSSAFAPVAQSIANFMATYDYTNDGGADGVAFVLHNDPRGGSALGDGGGAMGYGGGEVITNSAAVLQNIYGGTTGGAGTRFSTNGETNFYGPTGGVALPGGTTTVNLSYNSGILTQNLARGGNTYRRDYIVGDLATAVGGGTARVGFTGATGGIASNQSVSNFTFTPGAAGPAPTSGWRAQQTFLSPTNTANFAGLANEINNVNEGQSLANGTDGFTASYRSTPEVVAAINAPSFLVNGDNSNFVMKYSGYVDNVVGTSGNYNLYVDSDDGFRLNRNGVTIGEFVDPTGSSNVTISGVTLNDNDLLELYFFELGGGDFVTLRLNNNAGPLIGEAASGVLISFAPVPEPSSLALVGSIVVGGLLHRIRRARKSKEMPAMTCQACERLTRS